MVKIMEVIPVPNRRAVEVSLGNEKVLFVGDLHLGASYEVFEEKERIYSHVKKLKKGLLSLIKDNSADRLILLGDIIHDVSVEDQDLREILCDFMSGIKDLIEMEIVVGNHDHDIGSIVPEGTCVYGEGGTTIGNSLGVFHGHVLPDCDTLGNEAVLMAHEHPYIEERGTSESGTPRPVWIRTWFKEDELPPKFSKVIEERDPEVVILPAFNELAIKGIVNREIPEELLENHPLFRDDLIELDRARVYSLSGDFLGELGSLKGD